MASHSGRGGTKCRRELRSLSDHCKNLPLLQNKLKYCVFSGFAMFKKISGKLLQNSDFQENFQQFSIIATFQSSRRNVVVMTKYPAASKTRATVF